MSDRYVALIRHGAYHQRPGVPSALQPWPLTDDGRAQARACGQEIAALVQDRGWALNPVAHSSCQLRAWETARIALEVLAGAGHPCRIEQSPSLAERALGSAANLTLDEIAQALADDPRFAPPPPGWKSDSAYCLPLDGAESLDMAGRRVAAQLSRIVAAEPPAARPDLTLVFGHGASFRHAACELGVLARAQVPRLSMYHARPLLLCYKADGTWVHFAGAWKERAPKDDVTD